MCSCSAPTRGRSSRCAPTGCWSRTPRACRRRSRSGGASIRPARGSSGWRSGASAATPPRRSMRRILRRGRRRPAASTRGPPRRCARGSAKAGGGSAGRPAAPGAWRQRFIPRMSRGQRTPAYLQRLKADALLEAVGGQAEFPVVAETLRECFNDALDVTRLKRLLERLHDGEMWRRHVDTPLPSPFVYPLLLAWDWAYLGAGHAEERRSDAVTMRKAWSVAPGPPRPEIVAAVEAELQKTSPDRQARGANELAGILDDLGDLTETEIAARALGDAAALIAALADERRVLLLDFP